MSRTYRAGTVAVKCAKGAPTQFIWRDRLYRVESILQQWEHSAPWWHDVGTLPTGQDLQSWRVEASAGCQNDQGVYELGFDPAADRWYLIRTYD